MGTADGNKFRADGHGRDATDLRSTDVRALRIIDFKRTALDAWDQFAAEFDGVAEWIKATYQER